MTNEAFCSIWYICPKCQKENTTQFGHVINGKFVCRGCKMPWCSKTLYSQYAAHVEQLPYQKLHVGIEYLCDDCGHANFIHCNCVTNFAKLLQPGFYKHIRLDIEPNCKAHCEDCGRESKLIFPLPEFAEKQAL